MDVWTRRKVLKLAAWQFQCLMVTVPLALRLDCYFERKNGHRALKWQAFLDLLDRSAESQFTASSQASYVKKIETYIENLELEAIPVTDSSESVGPERRAISYPSFSDLHKTVSCQV